MHLITITGAGEHRLGLPLISALRSLCRCWGPRTPRCSSTRSAHRPVEHEEELAGRAAVPVCRAGERGEAHAGVAREAGRRRGHRQGRRRRGQARVRAGGVGRWSSLTESSIRGGSEGPRLAAFSGRERYSPPLRAARIQEAGWRACAGGEAPMASAGFFPSTMSLAGRRGARGATAVRDAGAGTREVDLRPSSVEMRRLRRAAASARPRRRAAVWKEGALLGAIWAVVRAQGWPEQGQRTASRLGRRSRGGARVSHR
nr:uncharacterized protein LOC127312546 [Lolium perenne]